MSALLKFSTPTSAAADELFQYTLLTHTSKLGRGHLGHLNELPGFVHCVRNLTASTVSVERDRIWLQCHLFAKTSTEQLRAEQETDNIHFARIKNCAIRRLVELVREQTCP